jgi:phosphoribosylformimino-5-aminoimidazole carboxamide ribotide isomerase
MNIIPAIDLFNEKCVRLLKGKPENVKTYYSNPLEAVKLFEDQGATLLHIIDLNAALSIGKPNTSLIKDIAEETSVSIQMGGGIRSLEKATELLKLGVDKVIFGTLAATQPKSLKEAIQEFGSDRIIVAIDEKNEQVVIQGWQDSLQMDYISFAKELEKQGVTRVIYTATSVDGTLNGPELSKIQRLLQNVGFSVIASGGVSTLVDLKALKKINVEGVVIGKALYEGIFSFTSAQELVNNC